MARHENHLVEAPSIGLGTQEQASGPPLYGVVDVLRSDRIAGWVIDRRDPEAQASVEIRIEGRLYAKVSADRKRRDLQASGLGTGCYGFSAPLDPPIEEGMEFTVSARAVGSDGAYSVLRPIRRLGPTSSEQRALARILEETAGCHDALQTQAENSDLIKSALYHLELLQARLDSMYPSVSDPAPRHPSFSSLVGLLTGVALTSAILAVLSL
ncbi:hypothetical protein [Rhodobacter sp. NSM]|uniref:hypothetical protein n=1 Tax=Rhodobacter sp. NSM TaxID=3457501 RepID=UPI003FD2D6BE